MLIQLHLAAKVKPHLAAKADDEQKDSVLFLVGAWLGGGTTRTLWPHL